MKIFLVYLKQFFCRHRWINIERKIINQGYYDQEEWMEVTCKRCKKDITKSHGYL